jgi:hypothetical protein
MKSSTRSGVSTLGRLTSVVVVTLQLGACTTTTLEPRVVAPMPDSLVLHDLDPPVTIHHPEVVGSEVVGWQRLSAVDSTEIRVPISIEREATDVGRTFRNVLIAVLGVILVGGMNSPG